jgi:putative redox protein
MTKTITVWKEKQKFKSFHDHNTIDIDGEKKEGFGSKALLLSAVAACSGIDIVEILQKMRIEFSDFEIETHADQTDKHPRVFKEIFITYKMKTDKKNTEKVKKAVSLSLEKYCGVSAMLRKNSTIHCDVKIL